MVSNRCEDLTLREGLPSISGCANADHRNEGTKLPSHGTASRAEPLISQPTFALKGSEPAIQTLILHKVFKISDLNGLES